MAVNSDQKALVLRRQKKELHPAVHITQKSQVTHVMKEAIEAPEHEAMVETGEMSRIFCGRLTFSLMRISQGSRYYCWLPTARQSFITWPL
jgi:hypothetical protein